MADAFLKAAEEFGYPHTDLNANYTQGKKFLKSTMLAYNS